MIFFLDDTADEILTSSADGWPGGELKSGFMVQDVHLCLLPTTFFRKERCMTVETLVMR